MGVLNWLMSTITLQGYVRPHMTYLQEVKSAGMYYIKFYLEHLFEHSVFMMT
jgi:hypothetical protein